MLYENAAPFNPDKCSRCSDCLLLALFVDSFDNGLKNIGLCLHSDEGYQTSLYSKSRFAVLVKRNSSEEGLEDSLGVVLIELWKSISIHEQSRCCLGILLCVIASSRDWSRAIRADVEDEARVLTVSARSNPDEAPPLLESGSDMSAQSCMRQF